MQTQTKNKDAEGKRCDQLKKKPSGNRRSENITVTASQVVYEADENFSRGGQAF